MAFDPVRDAILNSPERLSYADPFDDEPELESVNGVGVGDGQKGGIGSSELDDGFKAPAMGRTGSSSVGLRASDSPERPSSASAGLHNLVQTPGEYSFPPTPGGSYGSGNYGQAALTPGTAQSAHRQSSIFSLLSPEPPPDREPSSQQSYFDHLRESSGPVNGTDKPVVEPFVRPEPSTSAAGAASRLKPSLAVETTTARAKATPEPTKRGRPYAPVRRLNGPAPKSLYIPISADERAFYLDPANCKNPLRTGVSVAPRSAPVDGYNRKGKGRASDEPEVPDEIDVAPRYREPSPLDASLEPGFIQRTVGQRPPLHRNGSSGSPSKKRKRNSVSEAKTSTEYTAVAAHYNKRQNFSREERTNSPIIGLKSFNNWVKSVLIAKYSRDQLNAAVNGHGRGGKKLKVLDLGCGKGGDLQKWQKAGLREYIGVDIADVSIQQARSRWEQLRGPRFDAYFFALDAFSNPLNTVLPSELLPDQAFDTVTMQFCMHYAFQSVSKARMMLENVTRYLRSGGTFIGTIPDSENLLSRLREIPEDASRLTFGNDVYQITFDDRSKFPQFGHRYTFYLQDAVEDVPEYVVQWDAFESLAGEYGLKLLYHATFHELFEAHREDPEFSKLLERMKVVTPEGESELTEEQWEAANIYVAFAFQKI